MTAPSIYFGRIGWAESTENASSLAALSQSAIREGRGLLIPPSEHIGGIARARNCVVAAFLKSKCSHLLFVDNDIAFRPEDVWTLMDSGLPVVGIPYPLKGIEWKMVVEAVQRGTTDPAELQLVASQLCFSPHEHVLTSNEWPTFTTERTGAARFMRAKYTGTGFLMVTREAIEEYIAHYRHRIEHWVTYNGPRELQHIVFWDTMLDPHSTRERLLDQLISEAVKETEPGDPGRGPALEFAADSYRMACQDPETAGTHLTEDWSFCTRWEQMGGQVHVLVDAALTHLGRAFYYGKLAAVLMPMKEAAE